MNPFHYIAVWKGGDGKLNGEVLALAEYAARLRDKQILHSFTGRLATVCILSLDPTITRNDKLNFAIMFMEGKYVTIEVNLKDLTSKTTYPT